MGVKRARKGADVGGFFRSEKDVKIYPLVWHNPVTGEKALSGKAPCFDFHSAQLQLADLRSWRQCTLYAFAVFSSRFLRMEKSESWMTSPKFARCCSNGSALPSFPRVRSRRRRRGLS